MKKPLLIIGGISIGAVLFFSFAGFGDMEEFFATMGIVALVICALNLCVGVLLLLIGLGVKQVMPYAGACLLVAGLMLLCGFTLCSKFTGSTGHM